MGYIHSVNISNDQTYLIEPLLFAIAGGTSTDITAEIVNFTLVSGAYVNIKVGTVNANATLQIIYGPENANRTEKIPIFYNGSAINSNVLTENNIYTFVYDGTHWVIVGDITGKNIMIGTKTEWQSHSSYVAPPGTIIIYTDRNTYTDTNNNSITVPGVKIARGNTPVTDLPFVGDDIAAAIRSELNTHINNTAVHVSQQDRQYWDNKLNCNLDGERLQLLSISRE